MFWTAVLEETEEFVGRNHDTLVWILDESCGPKSVGSKSLTKCTVSATARILMRRVITVFLRRTRCRTTKERMLPAIK